jgi:hypothetical protein
MIPYLGSDTVNNLYPSHKASQQPITPAVKPPTLSIRKTMLAHSIRDISGQVVGRTLGLAMYNAAAYVASAVLPCQIVAGGVGAVFGGLQAQRVAAAQIGTESRLQQCGVAACTVVGATAGAAIAALGTYQPVAALAFGTALAVSVSLMKFCRKNPNDDIAIDASKATIFLIGTAASVSSITALDTYLSPSLNMAAKNLGVVVEAITVELFKSSFERCGPSVDRNTLNFNGKVYSSMAGLLPYMVATVLLNGYVSGVLQPDHETHQFTELILPLLIGAIANGVRGAGNAAAVYECHRRGWGVAKPDANIIRSHLGPKKPELVRMSKKTAIRFFLSACRNAVHDRLSHIGFSKEQASILSQGIYGFFAQNRDLVYDVMKGEGWITSTETPSTTTDNGSLRSVIIPIDTKSSNLLETSVEVSSASTTENSKKNSSTDQAEISIIVSAPDSSETSSEVSTE